MIKPSLLLLAVFAASATSLHVREPLSRRDLVDSESLRSKITLDALLAHAQKLQDFAFATPARNRVFGSVGHNDTVKYFFDTLTGLGDYYDVSLQPFSAQAYTPGTHALNIDGESATSGLFDYAPNGNVTEVLVPVADLGCNSTDYDSAALDGKIALISRGDCDFGLKSALAGAAGAIGAVIYNNVEGSIAGTLGEPPRPEGDYVPTLSVDRATGLAWRETIEGGGSVTANIVIDGSVTAEVFTNNVIAETKGGNHDDVLFLGAHSDSVPAGPGINDNGSGSVALLEIAKQLVGYEVNNAVRFAWWSAEESGLLGAEHWVATASQEERDKVRLYLNFDMIASPNYALNAYDGDGSEFGVEGPPGSAEAEKLFHDYFASVGLNSTASEFNGRSDYGPFLDAGIASGGLDTGAEGIKTEEEAALFGGEAGVAYDVNYHQAGDTIDNLARDALEANTKAIAHAVAVYGASFDSLPPKDGVVQQKQLFVAERQKQVRLYKGDLLVA
ncbi:hypothetical protein V5O48_011664 [Marasmius crinis-equi]|uniref:Peptide hydrolase n=1 Tax=Marasmius crinis-equi TaxID=585013 RepID=A0ABR3F4Z8_9AGAR